MLKNRNKITMKTKSSDEALSPICGLCRCTINSKDCSFTIVFVFYPTVFAEQFSGSIILEDRIGRTIFHIVTVSRSRE